MWSSGRARAATSRPVWKTSPSSGTLRCREAFSVGSHPGVLARLTSVGCAAEIIERDRLSPSGREDTKRDLRRGDVQPSGAARGCPPHPSAGAGQRDPRTPDRHPPVLVLPAHSLPRGNPRPRLTPGVRRACPTRYPRPPSPGRCPRRDGRQRRETGRDRAWRAPPHRG